MGRPSKYKAEFAKQAEKLCMLGATNRDLADFFEVSERTVERWAANNESFAKALKIGKEPADNRVERALYMRAIGYSHDDIDIRVVNGEIVETPYRKHYPPDTKAALAWLYNRRGEHWHPNPTVYDEDGEALPLEINFVVKDAKGKVKTTNAKP